MFSTVFKTLTISFWFNQMNKKIVKKRIFHSVFFFFFQLKSRQQHVCNCLHAWSVLYLTPFYRPDCIWLCGLNLKKMWIQCRQTAATPFSNLHKLNRILNYDFSFSQRFISDVQFGFSKSAVPLELHNLLLFMQYTHCCNSTPLNRTYGSDIHR